MSIGLVFQGIQQIMVLIFALTCAYLFMLKSSYVPASLIYSLDGNGSLGGAPIGGGESPSIGASQSRAARSI